MKNLRPRNLNQLNQVLVQKNPVRVQAILDVANLLDSSYNHSWVFRNSLGDCVLLKLNLINKRQIRKNPEFPENTK